MRLRVIRMDLPLAHVKTTPIGTVSVVRAIIVELEQDGLRGYGEVCEEAAQHTRVEALAESLEKIKEPLSRYALADPLAFERFIEPLVPTAPARCAVEMAACDLWGKMRNRPLRNIWKFKSETLPLSSYTIGQDSLMRALEKFAEAPDWPIYRLELGNRDDLILLEELRRRTNARFRVDVNGGWTLEQALDYLAPLQEFGVEMIEQPLPPDAWDRMKILKENSPIPIYADESCRSFADLEKCADYFHGVNLKPAKFGGLFATVRAIAAAKSLGLKTMIGNPVESTVSASAVSQFAPAFDDIYIDGPQQIDKRVGIGVDLDRGQINYPKENGSGVRFSWR